MFAGYLLAQWSVKDASIQNRQDTRHTNKIFEFNAIQTLHKQKTNNELAVGACRNSAVFQVVFLRL